jgi:two-component system NtrC family sensor kinase
MNLLTNAIEAQEDKETGSIWITTRAATDRIEIIIRDDGCGISPENLPKIFDPFFTTKEVGRGTGLGLSISHEIIRKHHGTIQCQSEPGKGSTFSITFPLVVQK